HAGLCETAQLVDQSSGNALLAFGSLSDISAISIDLGTGNNKITIDFNSFKDVLGPAISLHGGDGHDNLVFDNATDTQWSLTGKDAGTVSGSGVNVSFSNFDDLTAPAANNDTLTLKTGATTP